MEYTIGWLLIGVLIGDLAIPFLLAPFYRGYHHSKMVMSVLGSSGSPVRTAYNSWLLLAGIGFMVGAIRIRAVCAAISQRAATVAMVFLLLFGVGGFLLAAIFPVGQDKTMVTLSAKIHGTGAALGFTGLLFLPALFAYLALRIENGRLCATFVVYFVLALVVFVLFVMADKPDLQHTPVAWEGLWQRLYLLLVYLPIGYVAVWGIQ